MGGDIRCESTAGSGTCFYFTLPFKSKTSGAHAEVVEKKVAEESDGYDWSSKKILVVEDDPVNYLFIEKILEPTKVNLVHTEMAMPGIAACREDPAIDLVLMDIRLPDLSGWDATREIKKFRPNLPVIAQTANAMLEDKQKSFAAGCDDYLTKPFHYEELYARLNALLRRNAGHASPVIKGNGIELNTFEQKLIYNGKHVELTGYEYRVIEYLMTHKGKVVSKTELTEHIYDQDFDRDSNVLEVFIGRLRKKIDPEGLINPIETLRGQGYKFTDKD